MFFGRFISTSTIISLALVLALTLGLAQPVSADGGLRETLKAKIVKIEQKIQKAIGKGQQARLQKLERKLAKVQGRISALEKERERQAAIKERERQAAIEERERQAAIKERERQAAIEERERRAAAVVKERERRAAAIKERDRRAAAVVKERIRRAIIKERERRSATNNFGDISDDDLLPGTPQQIADTKMMQNKWDRAFLARYPNIIKANAPLWCHEAPGTNPSAAWGHHCTHGISAAVQYYRSVLQDRFERGVNP
jgi:TolA-binding protein